MIQSENIVKIEGILAETDLEEKKFLKDGKQTEAIGGSITIRVEQKIGEKDVVSDVPVYMFATKFTKKGTANPAYENIKNIKDNYVSIAASDEAHADKVRITNGDIRMNEYYGRNGNLVSFPRINASFVQRVRESEEFMPKAEFTCTAVVLQQDYELDKDQNETGRYLLKTAIVQYGDRLDVVPFVVESKKAINYISSNWESGNTVRINGKLNFSFKVIREVKESAFGDPVVNERTISTSELIVTGGSDPIEGEGSYNSEDIQAGLAKRMANLETLKNKANTKKAPAPATSFQQTDLGF